MFSLDKIVEYFTNFYFNVQRLFYINERARLNENSLVIIYGIHKFDYRRVLRIFIIEKDLDLMEMMEERWMYLSFLFLSLKIF